MQYRKKTTSSSLPSISVLLPLLSLFLSLLAPQPCSGVDVEKLCAARCRLGMGGNLCNCSTSHFAGKRGHEGVAATAAAGSGREDVGDNMGSRSWLELALRDMIKMALDDSSAMADKRGRGAYVDAGKRGRVPGGPNELWTWPPPQQQNVFQVVLNELNRILSELETILPSQTAE